MINKAKLLKDKNILMTIKDEIYIYSNGDDFRSRRFNGFENRIALELVKGGYINKDVKNIEIILYLNSYYILTEKYIKAIIYEHMNGSIYKTFLFIYQDNNEEMFLTFNVN